MDLEGFAGWLRAQGVAAPALPAFRSGAERLLAAAHGGPVFSKHVDQVIATADADGASPQVLGNLQKVGDMLLRYQALTEPPPRAGPPVIPERAAAHRTAAPLGKSPPEPDPFAAPSGEADPVASSRDAFGAPPGGDGQATAGASSWRRAQASVLPHVAAAVAALRRAWQWGSPRMAAAVARIRALPPKRRRLVVGLPLAGLVLLIVLAAVAGGGPQENEADDDRDAPGSTPAQPVPALFGARVDSSVNVTFAGFYFQDILDAEAGSFPANDAVLAALPQDLFPGDRLRLILRDGEVISFEKTRLPLPPGFDATLARARALVRDIPELKLDVAAIEKQYRQAFHLPRPVPPGISATPVTAARPARSGQYLVAYEDGRVEVTDRPPRNEADAIHVSVCRLCYFGQVPGGAEREPALPSRAPQPGIRRLGWVALDWDDEAGAWVAHTRKRLREARLQIIGKLEAKLDELRTLADPMGEKAEIELGRLAEIRKRNLAERQQNLKANTEAIHREIARAIGRSLDTLATAAALDAVRRLPER